LPRASLAGTLRALQRRKHAQRGEIRWPLAAGGAVLVVVVALGVWFLFLRDGVVEGEDGVPRFSFTIRGVKGVAVDGAAGRQELAAQARGIRETLDAMYSAGFVDPAQWQGGTFPAVLQAFSAEAAGRARKDLDDLSLGPTARDMDSVRPAKSTLDVDFLVDPSKQPYAAVAVTRFRAVGSVRDGGKVGLSHQGRYLLRPVEGRWLIVGYEVEGEVTRRAVPGGSA
jgi:hypothetical protein